MIRPILAATLALSTPLAAEPVSVVTDIAPVAALVRAVQNGHGSVAAVVDPADDPHHLSLRPSQARALSGAGLAVWIGPELAPWFGDALQRLAPATPTLSLLELAPNPLRRRAALDDGPVSAGDDEHDEDDHDHDHDSQDHDVGGLDPHGWLDPDNARAWLHMIAQTLGQADPDHADSYAENAAAAATAIAETVEQIAARQAGQGRFSYVASHDSFQYAEPLANAVFAGAVTDSHHAAPGPAHLAALKSTLDNGTIACLVTAPAEDSRLFRRLASDHGLPVITLEPMQPGESYTSWLADMHAAFAECGTAP